MSFVFPSVAALGAALAVAPVVVHLLTRRRRRVVSWGATRFLFAGSTRRRAWWRWSQWLLLAARVAAVLLAGVLMALPDAPDAMAAWFTGRPTTHLVLLDDSASMGETGAAGGPWREAVDAVRRLVERTSEGASPQAVWVLTYSGAEPMRLDSAVADESLRRLASSGPTFGAEDAAEGLRRLRDAASEASADGRRVVAHVVSDFRRWNHAERSAVAEELALLAEEADAATLLACGGDGGPNRTLSDLRLEAGARAAGVEMTAVVEVTNHGPAPTESAVVALRRGGRVLATLEVPALGGGESVVRRSAIRLAEQGVHVVTAELPADALAADNARRLAFDLPAAHDVLLLDGSDSGREGAVFAAALRPSGALATGWRPRVEPIGASQSALDEEPDRFAAVLLLDPEELPPSAAERLEQFAAAGGGVLLVGGPHTDAEAWNTVVAAGEAPLSPVRLGPPTQAPWVESGRPGVEVGDHPAMRALAGGGEGFAPLVRVQMAHSLEGGGLAEGAGEVVASLTDAAPLVVASRLGAGRVLTVLAPAAATDGDGARWTNLATLPVFPILANEWVGWLAEEKLRPAQLVVGDTVAGVGAEPATFERLSDTLEVEAERAAGGQAIVAERPGVWRRRGGAPLGGMLAVNVDPREGDLVASTPSDLRGLVDDSVTVFDAADAYREDGRAARPEGTRFAAGALLMLLVAERFAAYRLSHTGAAADPGIDARRAA